MASNVPGPCVLQWTYSVGTLWGFFQVLRNVQNDIDNYFIQSLWEKRGIRTILSFWLPNRIALENSFPAMRLMHYFD